MTPFDESARRRPNPPAMPLSRRQFLGVAGASAALVALPAAAHATTAGHHSQAGPAVFAWQSKTAVPGGAIALNGAGFTKKTRLRLYAIPASRSGGRTKVPNVPPPHAAPLSVARVAGDNIATVIPKDSPHGVYAVYASNDGHAWTTPFLFNAPQLWYFDRVKAGPGDEIRLVGSDLVVTGGTTRVWLQSAGGGLRPCQVTSAGQYTVTFTVPPSTPQGTYTLRLDNGALVADSNSMPTRGRLAVGPASAGPAARFDVTSYGADPTGAADSYDAITAALADAARARGVATVHLPQGTYRTSAKLTVPDVRGEVKVIGDGVDRTILTLTESTVFSPDMATGTATDAYSVGPEDELSLLYLAAGDSPVTISDLTLDTDGKRFAALGLNGRNNVVVDNVKLVCDSYPDDVWLFEGTTGLFALNNHDLDVRNTTITTSTGITLINATDIRVTKCDFSLFFPRAKGAPNNPENGAGDRGIRGWGTKRVTVVGNTFQRGSDTYYYGGATLFGAQKVDPAVFGAADASFAEDILVYDNHVTDAGEPESNDGEVFVGDQENGMPGTHKVLTVSSATATSASFAANTFATGNTMQDASGTYAFVLGGTGVGQVRRVASNTDSTLTLDQPWDVVPDATSAVVVTLAHVRHAYIGNTVKGCPKYVGMYGSAFSVIVADNVIDDTGAPGLNAAVGGDTGAGFHAILDANSLNPSLYPVAYVEVLRNTLTDAYAFVQGLAWATPPGNAPQYPMSRGSILADNTAAGAEAAAALYTSTNGNTPDTSTWGQYHVIARNSARSGTTYAASVGAAFEGTVIQQRTAEVRDSGTNSTFVRV